jgi:hypothetical protein
MRWLVIGARDPSTAARRRDVAKLLQGYYGWVRNEELVKILTFRYKAPCCAKLDPLSSTSVFIAVICCSGSFPVTFMPIWFGVSRGLLFLIEGTTVSQLGG